VILVQETVTLPNGTALAVNGKSVIVLNCVKDASGKTCQGTVQVPAVADNGDEGWF
jgi:hypothetical protein